MRTGCYGEITKRIEAETNGFKVNLLVATEGNRVKTVNFGLERSQMITNGYKWLKTVTFGAYWIQTVEARDHFETISDQL